MQILRNSVFVELRVVESSWQHNESYNIIILQHRKLKGIAYTFDVT